MGVKFDEEEKKAGRPSRPDLSAVREPTPVHCAWAAGIVEMRGTAYRHNTVPKLVIESRNDGDVWAFKKLQAYFGGSINSFEKREISRAETRIVESARYILYGARARAFFAAVRKYLSAYRREHIDAAWSA